MQLIARVHRWIGAIAGCLLVLMGLTGAVLVHRDSWIQLPHAHDPTLRDRQAVAAVTEQMVKQARELPHTVVLASERFGLNHLTYRDGSGVYVDQAGQPVVEWSSLWERPELWLLDFHKHLLAGKAGQWVLFGVACGALFSVLSGLTLWWRMRKSFSLRLLPAKFTRGAIIKHHRDFGAVAAPLLLLSLLSGATISFQPLSAAMGRVGAPAPMSAAPSGRTLHAADIDLHAMLARSLAQFPDAELRSVVFPRDADGLVMVRMRHPWEWQPNGNTALWFPTHGAEPMQVRDAQALPVAVLAYYLVYPLHAAKPGGLSYRLLMTLTGMALVMLGSLVCWSFWFRRPAVPRVRPGRR